MNKKILSRLTGNGLVVGTSTKSALYLFIHLKSPAIRILVGACACVCFVIASLLAQHLRLKDLLSSSSSPYLL